MRCQNCSAENPDGAKFCIECATPFSRLCPKCGFKNPPAAKFCAQCAAPLDGAAPIRAAASREALTGERRHLTVLFCDLVGSTAIAARLDPEQWRETLAGFHRDAAEAIARFDGHVAKYLGDGVMAYFGWPAAHDNDAERAARAGLAILDTIAKLNEQPGHAKLAARVGIDSGLVVIGKGAGTDAEVFGEVPNVAARIQAAAEPDTIAISDATQRLVSGLFIVEDRGAQEFKGIERPLQLYRVIRPSGARGRFDVATAAGGLTPFVGREDELRSLMNRWERAHEGEGQVALIVGEAGIGKSRLVQRLREQIAGTPHTWVEAGAGAFFQNTPFYPVTELLRQFVGEASVQEQLAQLESRLIAAGLKAADALPLIAPLLNLLLPPEYPPSTLAPEQQRRRLLATLVEWVLGSARAQPLVIATEDLHWADPSTLELIQLLVEQGATARLLLLYTARPEFQAPWPMRAHHAQIKLNRLTSGNVRAMVAQVAAKIALSAETVATVVERTGGVPLFVEELTRAVLESGDAKLSGHRIPATLHDSLMARLDRLGPAKEVIQVGAVIGSEFSYELIQAVHPIDEADLQVALRKLTDIELLYVRGIAPEATYQFKHALIRDAAYEALLKSRRKELHLIVARTIDEKFPALKEAHPEVLARHWAEAGELEFAIAEWTKAGKAAQARNAFREAVESYQRALALLVALPESADRDNRELPLQVALGEVMQWTRGWSAAETVAAYTRAGVLAERSGGVNSINILAGLSRAANLRGEPRAGLALADQAFAIAHKNGSRPALITAQTVKGFSRFVLGDLAGARQLYMQVMEYYSEEDFCGEPMPDDGIYARVFAGHTEWFLGYPERAVQLVNEALSIARRQNNPFLTVFALAVGSFVYELRRDYRRTFEAGDEAVHLNSVSGFPFINATGGKRRAWSRAQTGDAGGAADQIRAGLIELNSINHYASRAMYLVELAETQAVAGAYDEALVTVEQAVQTNADELLYHPGALWLRGELRLRADAEGEVHFDLAEQDFRAAIDLSRTMQAKSLELRATTSLARLLASHGRREGARAMLAQIYNWFTEGFDTADLKDAKALLAELGGTSA
jgi:class 3 adenylate cyclase/tetratricopeptide (TPR) repeat protein